MIPSPALGLHFLDHEFRCCLRYWLGLQLSSSEYDCPGCSKVCDPYGDHAVSCGGNGDRIMRHNSLREFLFLAAQAAALAPRREVPSLVPDSCSRPADVYLPSWTRGRPAAVDVTVISPLQQLTLSETSINQGSALLVAEQRKRACHLTECQRVGVTFIPAAVETLGGWSRTALSVIKSLGRLQGLRLGSDPSESTAHLLQRLSVCLWRANAQMWVSRIPLTLPCVDGAA